MAFSTALLEFITIHSLNVAPNSTAWSDTLETFWGRRGVPSKHHVCLPLFNTLQKTNTLQGRLRKRLSMALTWFQILDNQAEAYVSQVMQGTWLVARAEEIRRFLQDTRPRSVL